MRFSAIGVASHRKEIAAAYLVPRAASGFSPQDIWDGAVFGPDDPMPGICHPR
ncbi:hypothetical protein [Streptomyces sp. NPDC050485]|uniref:hypothetical protein n=1 Tax=Streptomyces sp. NPDC050485 TaxID=3365617 RepID=UPI003792E59A